MMIVIAAKEFVYVLKENNVSMTVVLERLGHQSEQSQVVTCQTRADVDCQRCLLDKGKRVAAWR